MDKADIEFANSFFQKAEAFIDQSSSTGKEIKPHTAAALSVLDVFGRTPDLMKSDGAGDRGIDWYTQGENECEIWQFKCRSELDLESYMQSGTPEDLTDISRILDWIQSIGSGEKEANKVVKKFQERLETLLRKKAETDDTPTYYFKVNIFIGCSKLTAQAEDELLTMQKRANSITEIVIGTKSVLADVLIKVNCLPDVISKLKAAENPDWFDAVDNRKNDKVTLNHEGKVIDDTKCQIFFAKALDLVDAYRRFGYRLFEPNVRCYLGTSRVNEAIRDSLTAMKGISNFKYLNNGVTIFYQNVNKRGHNQLIFTKPGIVNGLQTIQSLTEVYNGFSPKDAEKKKHFEENCYVQVRAFKEDSGIPVEDIIIATNNQNKMNQRNLESNTQVQKHYEYAFASRGWFYERKDGGWDAFSETSSDWPGLVGKRVSDFGGKQKKDRRVLSNEDVAVAWLAFTGYCDIARSEKTKIFENSRLRQRAFELIPGKHGYDYNFERNAPFSDETSIDEYPYASMLLVASLCHNTLKNVLPSKKQTDEKYIRKYGLEKLTKEQQQANLLEQADYLAELMMVSAPLTFVELCGYVFLKSVNGNYDNFANSVLSSPGFKEVFEAKDYNKIKDSISDETIEEGDFFVGMYFLWKYMWEEMASSSVWRGAMLADSSRPSFAHKRENRSKMLERVNELERVIQTSALNKPWSMNFDKHKTIISIIRKSMV